MPRTAANRGSRRTSTTRFAKRRPKACRPSSSRRSGSSAITWRSCSTSTSTPRRPRSEIGLPMVRAATVGTHTAYVEMVRELIVERLSPDAPRRALGTLGAEPRPLCRRLLSVRASRPSRSPRCAASTIRCATSNAPWPAPIAMSSSSAPGSRGCMRRGTLEAAGASVLVLEAQQRVGGRIHSMRQLGGTAEAGRHLHRRRLLARDRRRRTPRRRAHGRHAGSRVLPRAGPRARTARSFGRRIGPRIPANDFPGGRQGSRCRGTTIACSRCATTRSQHPSEWLDPQARRARRLGARVVQELGVERSSDRARLRFERELRSRRARRVRAAAAVSRRVLEEPTRARPDGQPGLHRAARRAAHSARRWPRRSPAAWSSATPSRHCARRAIARRRNCANGRRVTRAARRSRRCRPACCGESRSSRSCPPRKPRPSRALPSQPLTQVYLAPRSRFWEQDGYAPSLFTDTRAGMLAAARNRDRPTEVTSLTAWITGDTAAALDRLSPADAGRAVIAAIETMRPAAKGQLELIGMHSWGADPHAAGAWAYFRPGEVTRFAARARAAAWPAAFLRRASRDDEPRHGRRDGVGRRGRRGDPRRPSETRAVAWVSGRSRLMRFGHSGRRT